MLLKVKRNVWPGFKVPEVNIFVSELTVWGTLSLFVQIIVAPTGIVMEPGLKAKLEIETLCVCSEGVVKGVSDGRKLGPGLSEKDARGVSEAEIFGEGEVGEPLNIK